jgi:antitoxin (DNA-binding transcriptional repressor) of toxin-antitoxin stability system
MWQLQLNAAELIDRVAAGERVEITRNGRLVAVLSPPLPCSGPEPKPEQRVLETLVRTGIVGADFDARARGLADWEPVPAPSGWRSLSQVLLEAREMERR